MKCRYWLALVMSVCGVRAVQAEIPPVPEVVLPDPAATGPGLYPNNSVTSALFRVVSPPGVINAGSNQDQILVSVPNSGPIPWTINRYNEGDFAVQVSPKDPAAANALLGTSPPWDGSAAPNEYKFESGTQPQTQVWNLSSDVGVMIPTAAQNLAAWDDGATDYRPTVAVARASSGYGYNMVSGEWQRGGIDVNVGAWGSMDEGNASFSTTWFPYEQGWIAGWMGDTGSEGEATWASATSRSPVFDAVDVSEVMKWTDLTDGTAFTEAGGLYGGLGVLSLKSVGVNSTNDGMLFTISDDGSSNTNVTAASPLADGSGWIYSNREDNQSDPLIVAGADQSSFGFVYVPYSATNLIGGHIGGDEGNTIRGAGTFQIARTGVGTYDLTIPGKTAADGILMLGNADKLTGSPKVADRSHLSYEWNAAENKFVIQSSYFDGATKSGNTDFYFAFVDFEQPLTLSNVAFACGDFDQDRDVDSADLLGFLENWTGDSPGAGKTLGTGDCDGDGDVDSADLLGFLENWTGDGNAVPPLTEFTGPVQAAGAQAAVAAVPEPGSLALLLTGLGVTILRRRQR